MVDPVIQTGFGPRWAALEQDLRRFLAPRDIVCRREELPRTTVTVSPWIGTPPLAVLPKSTEQVAAVLKACHARGIPFVARGSGTGLSGGALVEEEACWSSPVACVGSCPWIFQTRRSRWNPG